MPADQPETRSKTYRLPVALIRAVDEAALAEGHGKTSGRVFNPSAIVERALREYFHRLADAEKRPKR